MAPKAKLGSKKGQLGIASFFSSPSNTAKATPSQRDSAPSATKVDSPQPSRQNQGKRSRGSVHDESTQKHRKVQMPSPSEVEIQVVQPSPVDMICLDVTHDSPRKAQESCPQEACRNGPSEVSAPQKTLECLGERDLQRRAKARRKLATMRTSRLIVDPESQPKGPEKKGIKYTPLEQQVVELKKRNPGVVLMVEVGYKMRFFGEDAQLAAQKLNIYCFADHNFMTASVPIHRLHVYVRRLVNLGHKVGVVRQMETAALKSASTGKGSVFVRKLTAVYTPATLEVGIADDVGVHASSGDADKDVFDEPSPSSYVLSIWEDLSATGKDSDTPSHQRGDVYFVAMDPGASTILWGQCSEYVTNSVLESALLYINPKEILVVGTLSTPVSRIVKGFVAQAEAARLEETAAIPQKDAQMLDTVLDLYGGKKHGKDDFHTQLPSVPVGALRVLAGAFKYLKSLGLEVWNECGVNLRPLSEPGHMHLSGNALAQLHVLTTETGSHQGSLLHLIDCTLSKFGCRQLRSWLTHPLTSMVEITERQDAVGNLLDENGTSFLLDLQEALRKAPDFERAVSRIFHRRANPAEFSIVMQAVANMPARLSLSETSIHSDLQGMGITSTLLVECVSTACSASVVSAAREMLGLLSIEAASSNNLEQLFTDEIRFASVFECHADCVAARNDLEALLPSLAKQAGVSSLTYTSIQNQGDCLLELPVDRKVPATWMKICSTKKVHRYRPAIVAAAMLKKDIAHELLTAECKKSWQILLQDFAPFCASFRAASNALATLDCLQSLATVAQRSMHCRPVFVDDEAAPRIVVKGGRAPVLDAMLSTGAVPNDVNMRGDGLRAVVINGPNMGGKSCYMRQVAQLVLMAQIGSWVPAESMELRVIDSVLTRMGAHDNILQGRSTFHEELLDASQLLQQATSSSLVILDELGRGTSTFDGVSIAIATLEHLVKTTRCLCLFVTHYPEVCVAAESLKPSASCYHMGHQIQGTWDLAFQQPNRKEGLKRSAGAGDADAEPQGDTLGNAQMNQSIGDTFASNDRVEVQKIIFLYKLQGGAANRSFGLNVAVLAGLPAAVVLRAAVVSAQLEASEGMQADVLLPEAGAAGLKACAALSLDDNGTGDDSRIAPALMQSLTSVLRAVDACECGQALRTQLASIL